MNQKEEKLLNSILFLDIETVPQVSNWLDLPEEAKLLWNKKTRFQRKEKSPEEFYQESGGIQAEFSKIICISCLHYQNKAYRIKSFASDDEKQLLVEFAEVLEGFYKNGVKLLCAHNGKEFDYPVLCRRMLIHDLQLPPQLDLSNKKTWQIPHYDTLDMWRFGDYKNYTSLELLAYIFGIPTPKSDIDGSKVSEVFYKEKDLNRIIKYCEKDTLTLFLVFCKISRIQLTEFTDSA